MIPDGNKVVNQLTLKSVYPQLSGWAQCNHKGSYKRETRKSKAGRHYDDRGKTQVMWP